MQQRIELENMGVRILNESRTELYMAMKYLGPALDALGYEMDLSTRTVGTDAAHIRYNPMYLMTTFLERPRRLLRCYVHMLLHCLFRHVFSRSRFEDGELFDLCADIAAESVLDSIDVPLITEIPSDFREEWYRKLKEEVHVLTAERLYEYFSSHPRDYVTEGRLALEFKADDHSFWQLPGRDQPEKEPLPQAGAEQNEEEWKNRAESTMSMLAGDGDQAGESRGGLAWTLAFEHDKKTDYRDFLRRFFSVKEEVRIDPDGFDYAYYTYGLELYGNMPLIEENEFRESCGIDELVIAIDTSGSTKQYLVQKYLNETAAILASGETFFHQVHIRLIECDDQIRKDIVLENVRDLEKYASEFELSGGMGTDFRPVFEHVRNLRIRGELRHLRGLMYFTDGFGTWPEEPAPYDTAFVFWTERDYNDRDVPEWAIRLYAGSGRKTVRES